MATFTVAGFYLSAFFFISNRVAYLTGVDAWRPWLFLAALLVPHLLWHPTFRQPYRAGFIAAIFVCAGAPEFLSIIAAV